MGANPCDRVNSTSSQLQSSSCVQKPKIKKQHPPKHDSWPRFVLEVWRGKNKTNHGHGRNDVVGWLVCREKHLRLIFQAPGKYMKVRFRGWEVSVFWHKKQQFWQAGRSLRETLPSAAASRCESGWVRRCTDPTRRLRLPETRTKKGTDHNCTFFSPKMSFVFWGQCSRSAVSTSLGSSPRSDCAVYTSSEVSVLWVFPFRRFSTSPLLYIRIKYYMSYCTTFNNYWLSCRFRFEVYYSQLEISSKFHNFSVFRIFSLFFFFVSVFFFSFFSSAFLLFLPPKQQGGIPKLLTQDYHFHSTCRTLLHNGPHLSV